MDIALPILNQCTKLRLMKVLRSVDMMPTSRMVLEFLIDEPGAAYWARTRFAAACRRQPRTIDLAFAELKRLGFIDVRYRRRKSCVKVLAVDAIMAAIDRATAIAKAVAKAAKAVWNAKSWARANKLRSHISTDYPFIEDKGGESAAWRVQGAPTSSLLRAMGLLTGSRRS